MIKMVQEIQKNGYAYETSDAIYFDTKNFIIMDIWRDWILKNFVLEPE